MSNQTPIELLIVHSLERSRYRIRTFPGNDVWWYCELLRDDNEWLVPGHLCGRMKPVQYVVLGVHPDTRMMSIYYGGRDQRLAKRIAKGESRNGAWVVIVEQLPTAPNKHDYPKYRLRGNPERPDPDTVATAAAAKRD